MYLRHFENSDFEDIKLSYLYFLSHISKLLVAFMHHGVLSIYHTLGYQDVCTSSAVGVLHACENRRKHVQSLQAEMRTLVR